MDILFRIKNCNTLFELQMLVKEIDLSNKLIKREVTKKERELITKARNLANKIFGNR